MGAEKRISSKDIGNPSPFVASYYKVFRVFEENKVAMENRMISKLSGVSARLTREQRRILLERGLIIKTTCRCGNFPMYYLSKYKVKSPKRIIKTTSQPDKNKRNSEIVINIFKKYKTGLTKWEVAQLTGVKSRRVNEEIQHLKQRGMITEKPCNCSHKTPFYYPVKNITEQVDRRHMDLRRK